MTMLPTMLAAALGAIPSPSDGVVEIGPIPLRAYGFLLAVGVLVAARLAGPRAVARGFAPGVIGEIATPVVIGGVVGARVYHLFTGYDWSAGGFWGIFQVWKGGLSIWGAVGGGLLVLVWIARRRNLDVLLLCDAIGPPVAVAQAIGRWGNYFNQELFGRPTTLPWGLKIDLQNRPPGYTQYETFHPTFLYESLWALLIFAVIVGLERRRGGQLARGQSFALYVALYTFERFFMELLRIDDAAKIFGLRFNALLSATLFFVSAVWFVRLGRRAGATPATPETKAETS